MMVAWNQNKAAGGFVMATWVFENRPLHSRGGMFYYLQS